MRPVGFRVKTVVLVLVSVSIRWYALTSREFQEQNAHREKQKAAKSSKKADDETKQA